MFTLVKGELHDTRGDVYFVHISDTHIGPTADFERHGVQSLPCAEKLVNLINNLPQKPDFVIHTGDIVTDPHPVSYQIAADVLSKLDVPVYYVVGNHDTAQDIRTHMTMGEHTPLTDNEDLLTYAFAIKGYRFVVIDCRAPDEMDPLGTITDEQLEIVRQELAPYGEPLTLFIHHPVLPINTPWAEPHMLLENGVAFHEVLLQARSRLRGVFHGHIHQHLQTIRDGITYTSVASSFAQFTGWPVEGVEIESDAPPGFNFVHMLPQQTIVQQHTFSR